MDTLCCAEFACNVTCNLLQFAPNFWFLKRHVYKFCLSMSETKVELEIILCTRSCARYWLQLPSHLKDCSIREFTSGHKMA